MTAAPLRLALVVPFYEPDADVAPRSLQGSALGELAAALAARGHTVRAWQLARRAGTVAAGGATIELVPSSALLRQAAAMVFRRAPRYGPAYFEPAWRLNAALAQWSPQAVHSAGLTMDLNLGLTGRTAARSAAPLLVHFHGGLPAADAFTNRLRRANARRAARVLFTHPEQAAPWVDTGILRPDHVGQAFETSVRITPLPRALARARTGIDGDPACLMLGRLEAVKDPVTTLAGFALIAERRPLARLHVYALTEGLRRECEALVAAIPGLAGRVSFRPAWPRDRMAELYSAADLLLQSSRREWSSLTVMEALACGCLPVLSAIPAFRALTDEGRVGALFPMGRPELLADAALRLGPLERRTQAPLATRRFQEALSFEALAERIEAEARGAMRRGQP